MFKNSNLLKLVMLRNNVLILTHQRNTLITLNLTPRTGYKCYVMLERSLINKFKNFQDLIGSFISKL